MIGPIGDGHIAWLMLAMRRGACIAIAKFHEFIGDIKKKYIADWWFGTFLKFP